jgi:hypothetical protein
MTDSRLEQLQKLLVAVLFASLFFRLAVPVFDPDFWWHLAAGKWMAANRAIISGDPFTIDSKFKTVTPITQFILKQYWLSQLVFFWTYSLAGLKGIILLTASVFTLMFFTLYRLILKAGGSRLVAGGFVWLAATIIIHEFNYIGSKPQMWSSLFSVLLLACLEALRTNRTWARWATPALMLLWANLHGGFIMGDVIMLLYAAGLLLARSASRPFLVVCAAALLASGLNPNGFAAFTVTLPFLGQLVKALDVPGLHLQEYKSVVDSLNENQSIFRHAGIMATIRSLPFFTLLLLLSLATSLLAMLRSGRTRAEHLLLYLLVFLMGLRSIRFIIFFSLIASFLTAVNLQLLLQEGLSRSGRAGRWLTGAVLFLASAGFLGSGLGSTPLRSGELFDESYAKAADFIAANRLAGNMFNDYNIGGYLIWRLAPDIKFFVDGRILYNYLFQVYQETTDNPTAMVTAHKNSYQTTFDFFAIDLVLIPGCDKVSGTLIKLAPALLEDPDWPLVYADRDGLIFLRNTPKNRPFIDRHRVPASQGYRNIYSLAMRASRDEHAGRLAYWKLGLAVAYRAVGDGEEAARWLSEYMQKYPADPYALDLSRKLNSSGKP